MVVIRLQLFKGEPNNKNLTKLEHTHAQINLLLHNCLSAFSSHWDENKMILDKTRKVQKLLEQI